MLKNKIVKYDVKEIAKKIGVPKSTIYRWIRLENLNNTIKFLEFINHIDVDTKEFIEWYKKRNT